MTTANGNGAAPAIVCSECGALSNKAMSTIAALEAALVARQCTINALKAELEDKRETHKHREAARRICAYWNIVVRDGKARTPDSKERFTATAARLMDGYTEVQLREAVDGAAYDPYVIKGKTYNDLTTVMKSAAAVDNHISRRPSEEEMVARVWLKEPPSDWFWLDMDLQRAREEAELRRYIREVDQLTREILAGGGPLKDYYQARHELRAA